jgi:RNA polymerase sigma factor (sigma-70 family)
MSTGQVEPAGARAAAARDDGHLGLFEEQRDVLFGVAYRMLGGVADAQDVVQEAWLRWAKVDLSTVADPRAFLVRVTTRLALDQLRRVKTRREAYAGPWLPEPLLTAPDVAEDVERAESVSMALLVVLETLSPLERAVFVLREAFGFSHAEIADFLGRSEQAVRTLATRARAHVHERRPRFATDRGTRRRVTERFLRACIDGDVDRLMSVLAPGVALINDGGGGAGSARLPVRGAGTVTKFLQNVSRPATLARYLRLPAGEPLPPVRLSMTDVNGGPGIVAFAGDRPIGVLVLEVADERVQLIRLITNPAKLAHLGRPAGG